MQRQKTRALKDTLDTMDDQQQAKTVDSIYSVGRHVINELNLPRWMKRTKMLGYVQTLVSISPPAIQSNEGTEFEFEPELTSQPLQEVKRSKRHLRAYDLLAKDKLLVIPERQVQQMPGVPDDLATFDIFPHSVRLRRNFKKDIDRALKKRVQYSISNIKLPEMKADFHMFKPLKHRGPIENSPSLTYDAEDKLSMMEREKVTGDRDTVFNNIRAYLVETGRKMKGVSVELIDAILHFETVNVFST